MPVYSKDYPTSFGNVRAAVITLVGPASYTQYTAPSTGGQDVQVGPESGLKVIDWISPRAITQDGLHEAVVQQIESDTVNGVSLGNAKFILKWYVVTTGAQVAGAVDLSAVGKTVRFLLIGAK
jgi:hypothetical protein